MSQRYTHLASFIKTFFLSLCITQEFNGRDHIFFLFRNLSSSWSGYWWILLLSAGNQERCTTLRGREREREIEYIHATFPSRYEKSWALIFLHKVKSGILWVLNLPIFTLLTNASILGKSNACLQICKGYKNFSHSNHLHDVWDVNNWHSNIVPHPKEKIKLTNMIIVYTQFNWPHAIMKVSSRHIFNYSM